MGCSLRRFNRFYLFTTTVIMIAGGGATLEMWHVPYWWGIGALSALIVFVFQED